MSEFEEKRGAGRPAIDSEVIFNELMSKPETREKLKEQIKYLVTQRKIIVNKQDIFKEDVKGVKESTGLATSFLTKIVDAIVKDEVPKKLREASQLYDLLHLFDDTDEESDGGDEEDFDE